MTSGRATHARAANRDTGPVARALALPGEPEAWERLGFTPFAPIGEMRATPGATALELAIARLHVEWPDGLRLSPAEPSPRTEPGTHPNGAIAVDHVVALTDDMDRTLAALGAAGLELRRERRAPARQAFFNLRTMILEVVEADGAAPSLWGLTVVVEDLDALGPLVGEPRDAVQPGRRIATVRRDVGLPTALAFMTPRPQRSRPS
jgi:hypothetical protein